VKQVGSDTIYALLKEIKAVAMNASLTGALEDSSRALAEMYNRCVDTLEEQGDRLVGSLFPQLDPDEANMDEIGALASLLAQYLRPKEQSSTGGSGPLDDEE
jgi:hypothetical protein